jgi:5'-methylthioadenosine phosphorylase
MDVTKPPSADLAEIGVFGGSGFYELLEGEIREQAVETPFGPPSDTFTIGRIGDKRVAFLPRHGRKHQYPAHAINYRANVWAMASLGVKQILGPAACGSLDPRVEPGHFVLCDQFVDRTYGRAQTFYDGPQTVHISTAHPYCPELRTLASRVCHERGIPTHERGTVVVIQGPRFSTRAESQWFSNQGWEVINMTQFPEVPLALELELCYLNISLITDYDTGLEGRDDVEPVSVEGVIQIFNQNNHKVKEVLEHLIPRLPTERSCPCSRALQGAVVG